MGYNHFKIVPNNELNQYLITYAISRIMNYLRKLQALISNYKVAIFTGSLLVIIHYSNTRSNTNLSLIVYNIGLNK